jgi:glycosyltransferase involved in cell wall biosynthesis
MFFNLGAYAKKINPDIRVVCLIADIPKYATTSTLSGLRKIYHDYEVKKCDRLYGIADKYVLLTEHMASHLGIRTPYMVMEGVATSVNDTEIEESGEEYGKYILYTGLLNEKFGIPVLLEAFGKIKDENVKLVLCGTGDAQELIAKKQLEDNRIIAPGRVDRKKALALQRGATVLVNPRQNNEEFTKYSFPSKNLEYLSSGVPVVAYKLDGIPDEYDDYINYPADDSAEAMCNELERLLGMTDEERKAVGQRAKEFVLGTKNKVQQTKRIIDFLNT